MKARCLNPNDKNFRYYGGKGIAVCEQWLKFENFLADMGPRPEGKSLDRVDNSLGYESSNCRWATDAEQSVNRTDNVRLEFDGETLTVSQWAERLGVDPRLIHNRITLGMSLPRVLDGTANFATRCSGCDEIGHTKGCCPKIEHAPRKCSKCGSTEHNLRNHWRTEWRR